MSDIFEPYSPSYPPFDENYFHFERPCLSISPSRRRSLAPLPLQLARNRTMVANVRMLQQPRLARSTLIWMASALGDPNLEVVVVAIRLHLVWEMTGTVFIRQYMDSLTCTAYVDVLARKYYVLTLKIQFLRYDTIELHAHVCLSKRKVSLNRGNGKTRPVRIQSKCVILSDGYPPLLLASTGVFRLTA